MQHDDAQKILDEKLNALSADKRELLELLLGNENTEAEIEPDSAEQNLGEAESKLKRIWEEVLNCGAINVRDNFFALGGDSLHCIQIVAKARKEGVNFTTAELFEAQTIEKLAQKIKGSEVAAEGENQTAESSQFEEADLKQEELEKLLQRI